MKHSINQQQVFEGKRHGGMGSTPKMEYQVFLWIFLNNSAMATLGLKEMGKFLWEGKEKGGKSRKREGQG